MQRRATTTTTTTTNNTTNNTTTTNHNQLKVDNNKTLFVAEPLDEADQEKIVNELHDALTRQQQLIHSGFRYAVWCILIAGILFSLYTATFLVEEEKAENDNDDDHNYNNNPIPNLPHISHRRRYHDWDILFVRIGILLHGAVGGPLLHYLTLTDTTTTNNNNTPTTSPFPRRTMVAGSQAVQQQQQTPQGITWNRMRWFLLILFNLLCPLLSSLWQLWNHSVDVDYPSTATSPSYSTTTTSTTTSTTKTITSSSLSSSPRNNDVLFMTHAGLLVFNLCTLGFALVVYLDDKSTQKSLHQLEQARYRFKSL